MAERASQMGPSAASAPVTPRDYPDLHLTAFGSRIAALLCTASTAKFTVSLITANRG